MSTLEATRLPAVHTADETYAALTERLEDYRPESGGELHSTEHELGITPTELQFVPVAGIHKLLVQNETVQPGSSFKYNGMAFALRRKLQENPEIQRLYIGSAGNAAATLVAAAARYDLKVIVEAPETLVDSKYQLIQGLLSEVNPVHDSVETATKVAEEKATADPYGEFIHAYDDIDAIAGQGLVAKRAFRSLLGRAASGLVDLENQDINVLIQRGGGSLLTGFACELYRLRQEGALGDNVRLYEVRPAESADKYDGLHVAAPGSYASSVLNDPRFVHGTVFVNDVDTGRAATDMGHMYHRRFEPSGLAGVAAYRHLEYTDHPTTFVTVLSGANYSQNAYDYFHDAPRRAQARLLGSLVTTEYVEPEDGVVASYVPPKGLNPCDYGRHPHY